MKYQPIIGLEIHAELDTKSKMFCSCANDSDEKEANINVCPVCMGHPGTLPVINEQAVKKVIKTGLALNCEISSFSKFDRKNYFYPDLPKGYQISQFDLPLCGKGFLNLGDKKIRITRIHLEEDAGRLLHFPGKDYSLVDYNRVGLPLMELVTEPDLRSGKEVRRFCHELQLIFRYLGVSNANMEKGEMRCGVNLSLGLNGKLGTKVEMKNLNSFRVVEKAIEYEIKRQEKLLLSGQKVVQETRGWNDAKEITLSQRGKEESHDYRYFPEPDLPPLSISEDLINEMRSESPEVPQQKRERFEKEYGLSEELFIQNRDLGEYFEKAMSELQSLIKGDFFALVKICSNYLITDLQGLMGGFSEKDLAITPENFAEFISLIYNKEISSKIAKQILSEMLGTGADPSQIIEQRGLSQITDELEIEEVVKKVILANQEAVKDFKKGKENALQYLAGQVMAETKGKASPQIVQEVLRKQLSL